MADQINIVNLPPTQYLVLEVLAARTRTGEHLWTFPSNLGPALRALEDASLISTMNGIAPASIRARLTETGRAYALKSNYAPPVIEMLTKALELLHDFADDDACHFDHHGDCQSHGSIRGTCRNALIKDLLDWHATDTAPYAGGEGR